MADIDGLGKDDTTHQGTVNKCFLRNIVHFCTYYGPGLCFAPPPVRSIRLHQRCMEDSEGHWRANVRVADASGPNEDAPPRSERPGSEPPKPGWERTKRQRLQPLQRPDEKWKRKRKWTRKWKQMGRLSWRAMGVKDHPHPSLAVSFGCPLLHPKPNCVSFLKENMGKTRPTQRQ